MNCLLGKARKFVPGLPARAQQIVPALKAHSSMDLHTTCVLQITLSKMVDQKYSKLCHPFHRHRKSIGSHKWIITRHWTNIDANNSANIIYIWCPLAFSALVYWFCNRLYQIFGFWFPIGFTPNVRSATEFWINILLIFRFVLQQRRLISPGYQIIWDIRLFSEYDIINHISWGDISFILSFFH